MKRTKFKTQKTKNDTIVVGEDNTIYALSRKAKRRMLKLGVPFTPVNIGFLRKIDGQYFSYVHVKAMAGMPAHDQLLTEFTVLPERR